MKTGLDLKNPGGMDLALPGWLLGGAIGSAIGAAVRFDSAKDIMKRHGELGPAQFTDVFGTPGAITSDMQHTLFAADSMIRAHVRSTWLRTDPVNEVKLGMRRWLLMEQEGWFPRANELYNRRWADRTTVDAIREFVQGNEFGTIEKPLNDSQENSALGRAGAAALWSDNINEVFELGARIAALTHGHPNAYLAAGAYAVMLHFAMRNNNVIRAIDAARAALAKWEHREEVDATLLHVRDSQFAPDAKTDPETMASMGDSNTALGALAIGARAVISEHRFEYVLGRAIVIDGDSAATGLVAGTFYGIAAGTGRMQLDAYGEVELADRIRTLAYQITREYGGKPPSDDDFYSWFPYDKRLSPSH